MRDFQVIYLSFLWIVDYLSSGKTLQERFQRCAVRCQALARDGLGYDAKLADQERAQAKFNGCLDECGKECLSRIPKLKQDIVAQIQRL